MAYLQYKAIKGLGIGTLKKLRAETKLNASELSSNIKSPKFRSTEKIMKYKKSIHGGYFVNEEDAKNKYLELKAIHHNY